jgi:tetratricopeptide (TPR) repeat protein
MATIPLRNILTRAGFLLLEVVVFVALVVWITRNYIADEAGKNLTAPSLARAARLDPGNSENHLRLGRLLQYSITEMNPEQATRHFHRASELNPRDPQPWLELSAAYGFQGNVAEAEACLRRADRLAPNLPSVQWIIANFFLLQGNIDEAFRHFKVVLAGSHQYNQILFRTAWKASDDGAKILEELIPRRTSTEFNYLNFLLSEKRMPEALAVWKRIVTGSDNFNPVQASSLMDRLIVERLPGEAAQVWGDLRSKGLINPTYQPTAENQIVNGDFEEDILNAGFDWRIAKVEGVHVAPDGSNFHSPSRALQISFDAKTNLSYSGVYQFVRVQPSRAYRLRAFIKTEGITTDSGPRLRVRDYYDATQLHKFSESITGTTGGWTPVNLDFMTGPMTELILVSISRLPSTKLDNLIRGRVWVDDASLTEISAVPSRAR